MKGNTMQNKNELSEKIKQMLELQQEDMEQSNGMSFCKNCGLSGNNLLNKINELVAQERAEAVKDFAMWFEANTGGLYRGEMETKWNEYLKLSQEKHD